MPVPFDYTEPEHGTWQRYQYKHYRCRTCAPCRRANAAWMRSYRMRKRVEAWLQEDLDAEPADDPGADEDQQPLGDGAGEDGGDADEDTEHAGEEDEERHGDPPAAQAGLSV